jgi:hypothetical protein
VNLTLLEKSSDHSGVDAWHLLAGRVAPVAKLIRDCNYLTFGNLDVSDDRFCVYTALIGAYEPLVEQPAAAKSRIRFICLTDDQNLRSESWEVRHVSPVLGMDAVRSQRDVKIRPYVHLPDFDVSLYIDNSILLKEPPESLFEFFDRERGFCLPAHSYRDTVQDEFLAVAQNGLDDQSRVFEQLNHYLIDCPDVLQQKPYWNAILLRDHHNATVRATLDLWMVHVHRYSRRDQLSINVALRHSGLQPQVLQIDNYESRFHSWPHIQGRDWAGRRPQVSLCPPGARIRELEQQLAAHTVRASELEQQLAAISASMSWRITAPLRNVARLSPAVAYLVRRGLKFIPTGAASGSVRLSKDAT